MLFFFPNDPQVQIVYNKKSSKGEAIKRSLPSTWLSHHILTRQRIWLWLILSLIAPVSSLITYKVKCIIICTNFVYFDSCTVIHKPNAEAGGTWLHAFPNVSVFLSLSASSPYHLPWGSPTYYCTNYWSQTHRAFYSLVPTYHYQFHFEPNIKETSELVILQFNSLAACKQ